MSLEEFAAMPREEAVRYELAKGELVPFTSGTPRHAWIRDEFVVQLKSYLRAQRIGIVLTEVDCRTIDDTVRRPDLFLSFQ
jgi:Uma2 family endonuclease